jgi:ribosomal protein S18 acetylase RimI-like enzyme
MSGGHAVRRATESDIEAIMAILNDRRDWLRTTKFSNQWASVPEWRQLLCYLVRRGHVWVLVTDDDNRVVGTITVGTDPDRDFWSDCERRVPALYISKLATDLHLKGQELGSQLLAWARLYAASQYLRVLRLDTWKTSQGLHGYYATRGWQHVRTVELAHRESGSLFERPVEVRPGTSMASSAHTGQLDVSVLRLMAASTGRPRASFGLS